MTETIDQNSNRVFCLDDWKKEDVKSIKYSIFRTTDLVPNVLFCVSIDTLTARTPIPWKVLNAK